MASLVFKPIMNAFINFNEIKNKMKAILIMEKHFLVSVAHNGVDKPHLPLDKMAAILQTSLNGFSQMKLYDFDWNLLEFVPWCPINTIHIIGSDNGLAPTKRQAIIWTNDGLVWWGIYAFLSLNELTSPSKSGLQIQISFGVKKYLYFKKGITWNKDDLVFHWHCWAPMS